MAIRITQTLVDDVDGTEEANQTVGFALDGTSYEIDLTDKRAEELRNLIGEWTGYARVTSRPTTPRSHGRRRSTTDHDPVKVREWAKTQGIEISERGRISSDILNAYRATGA